MLLGDVPVDRQTARDDRRDATVTPFMYPDRFRLPFLTGVLIAAAERRRPGLGPWSPQVEDQLRRVFETELEDVRKSFLESFDDPGWFDRGEETIQEIALPRYLVEAKRETDLEQREFGIWRGGDLVSRIVWGLGGLALGLFLVKAPFIPIPTSWDLFALALLLGAPFIPDVQVCAAPPPAPPCAPGHRRGLARRRGPARALPAAVRARAARAPFPRRSTVRQKG